jgi:MarR family transcriptional regulator, organic hydroperoxide resistance regulator
VTVSTKAPAQPDAAAHEAWRLLRELWFANLPGFQAACSEHELTKPQAGALLQLDPDRPIGMSALAGVLMCDASNVTGLVDRLEDRGLVERQSAPHDRRIKMLALTPAGARVRRELDSRLGNPPPGLAALSAADQRALRDLLRRALERQATA